MSWGPFARDIDAAERKARSRCLRLATKILAGQRGQAANLALLRFEISGDDADMLAEAEAEFDRLAPLDRRRIISSYAAVA